MIESSGAKLIDEMMCDPKSFYDAGKSHQLLKEYFDGFPRKSIIPALQSDNDLIRRIAVFIVAELGKDAGDLVDYVVPLLRDKSMSIRWYAMESIMVCSYYQSCGADQFYHVVEMLADHDSEIRCHAMLLLSRASEDQVRAAIEFAEGRKGERAEEHKCLLDLFASSEKLSISELQSILESGDELAIRYAAAAVRKMRSDRDELRGMADDVIDEELKKFFEIGGP